VSAGQKTRRLAGDELDRIHRKELRELDTYRTIALLWRSGRLQADPALLNHDRD